MSLGFDYSRFDNIDTSSSEDENSKEGEDDSETLDLDPAIFRYTELPDGWIRVGHVVIHPSERKDYFAKFSPTILTEDPNTFVPNPADFEDGIVSDWGIQKSPIEAASVDDPELYAKSLMVRSNRELMDNKIYKDKDGPLMQFIRVLEQRKLKSVEDPRVQEALDWTYCLKITLCQCEQDVWRLIRVPAAIDLSKLHDQVLVPVLGWSRGYHAYVFEDPKDGAVLGPKKYAGHIDMMHAQYNYSYILDDRRFPLAALMHQVGDFIQYTYDLGDNWCHKIELVDISILQDNNISSQVQILDGAGACPPEDGNGLEATSCRGYASFLKEYKQNRNSPTMKKAIKMVESQANNYSSPWMGPPIQFKPLEFDIQHHRLFLKAMLAGPAVQKKQGLVPSVSDYKHSYRACTGCGDTIKALMKCSKCGSWYCSRQCQVEDWKNHKKRCKELRKRKEKPKP